MNELEKAKAYDEAVEKARQEYNATENVERKQWLEELFPQLRENKDEKIRKSLIRLFSSNNTNEKFDNISTQEIIGWLEKQDKRQKYQSNERAWLYLVADVLTWREGIGQYLDDPRVQELAKKLQKEYSQKLQCKKISKLDIDDMVEKYRQEQFPLHNSSTSSHNPYYPIGYIDNMIAQYRKGINDTLNLVLNK